MMPRRSRRSSQSSGRAWNRKDGKINYSEFVAMMKKGTGSTETTNPKKRRDLPDGSTLRYLSENLLLNSQKIVFSCITIPWSHEILQRPLTMFMDHYMFWWNKLQCFIR